MLGRRAFALVRRSSSPRARIGRARARLWQSGHAVTKNIEQMQDSTECWKTTTCRTSKAAFNTQNVNASQPKGERFSAHKARDAGQLLVV